MGLPHDLPAGSLPLHCELCSFALDAVHLLSSTPSPATLAPSPNCAKTKRVGSDERLRKWSERPEARTLGSTTRLPHPYHHYHHHPSSSFDMPNICARELDTLTVEDVLEWRKRNGSNAMYVKIRTL